MGTYIIRQIDRIVASLLGAMQWLVLPLVVLLFLQWPLRDIFRAYSREANDLAQVIFALFVAVSVTSATRAGTHLVADMLTQGYPLAMRRTFKRIGAAFGLLPWALFIFYAGHSAVVQSLSQMEGFPDTYNPGYFIIKAALWLMALLIAAQSLIDIVQPDRTRREP